MRTYELLAQHGAKEPTLFKQCRMYETRRMGRPTAGQIRPLATTQLRTTLMSPLGLAERYVAFEPNPPDPDAECARIADWLDQNGPIDISVLGLGINGHLGFTEPAEYLQPFAHVAELSQASLAHAMLAKSDVRPTYGLTLGMADLIQSRHILLLVTGPTKRDPLQRLLSGRIINRIPRIDAAVAPRTSTALRCRGRSKLKFLTAIMSATSQPPRRTL